MFLREGDFSKGIELEESLSNPKERKPISGASFSRQDRDGEGGGAQPFI